MRELNSIFKPLNIGDLKIEIPIIQGGMGVKVSTAPLASAVANCGAAGTIASVGLGHGTKENDKDYVGASNQGLINEINEARELTNGVFGINIMVALSNYADLVKIAIQNNVDFIASGAGLPLKLPEIVNKITDNCKTKLIPIVSSAKAAKIIILKWMKNYNKIPDAFIVEGPLAGGHLGFKFDDLINGTATKLENIVLETIETLDKMKLDVQIPIIAAGGIFDKEDIQKFFNLGAKAVQIGSRFVATVECAVSKEFKKLYLSATDKDIKIIESPVGMPGRAISTPFIQKTLFKIKEPIRCNYRCLYGCDPKKAPYCIANAMFRASEGKTDEAVVFAGANVPKIQKETTVKDLIYELSH